MKKTVVTQIRLSEQLDAKITELSNAMGVSKNAAMCMMMSLGIKLYESDLIMSTNMTEQ